MKNVNLNRALFAALLLLGSMGAGAQKTVGIDLASIRNIRHQLNGLNVSAFYHFNERLIGGIEMNRFMPVSREEKEELLEVSAWDFDLNFHYLLPLNKTIKLYPLTGISHTSEKELNRTIGETSYERFWSFNTGAGVLFSLGRWSPHLEYMFTWGHINQQFLLAGISYELEWGYKEKK